MKVVDFSCPPIGSLKVIGNRLHEGHDFFVMSNVGRKTLDYLFFFDSRGIGASFEQSLAKMLMDTVSRRNKTYLIICRPLNLTIWATLIGFLQLNNLTPKKIITNMGFVDFTPKKKSVLSEAILQVDNVVGKHVASSNFLENYDGANGDLIALYGMHYGDLYRSAIEAICRCCNLVILNTPPTDRDIAIQRRRPSSFFIAQMESNEFNRSIERATVLDFPTFNESLTYDAVHFTQRGNAIIFDSVEGYL